jgi:hypothetical protein
MATSLAISEPGRHWLRVLGTLNEYQARVCVAQKVLELGRGGISRLEQLTGMSRPTIAPLSASGRTAGWTIQRRFPQALAPRGGPGRLFTITDLGVHVGPIRVFSSDRNVPKSCPSRAHSGAFQRTSLVQAVTIPSFQIQLERALLTRSRFLLRAPVWLVPFALTGSARRDAGRPRGDTGTQCHRVRERVLCYLRSWRLAPRGSAS